jgi:hypothetical protein
VAIDFFNLVDDIDWVDMPVKQTYSKYLWHAGGPLGDAPVDMAATFAGGMQISTKIDRTFNQNGLRCSPNFVVPRHHHNIPELIIVLKGEFTIEYGGEFGGEFGTDEDLQRRRVCAGGQFISQPGTPYTMIAGPEGVTYIETWPEPMVTLETVWYDHGWIPR